MDELIWRKFELMRLRWRLLNGRAQCDSEILPAALDWLNGQIASIEKEKQPITAPTP
ncbi:hypothetical protein M3201_18490 [Paenibacillus motobuensis]|uniref:hypothetical protein n=1 Tax=Paenibacillus TaxID=44249 RepID=UPI00203C751E|nr:MULTISPECIES: hypothetical protein [Paenibacillus]MCM3041686.1 hypothetical protein [Paenibacillus lutimineralis]MCM3648790.1 hypothetical protein [Paenibacillus motobuensis]